MTAEPAALTRPTHHPLRHVLPRKNEAEDAERWRKTARQAEDKARQELEHRAEHTHTSTHLHFLVIKSCSGFNCGYGSYITQTSLCALPSSWAATD